jgi:hypothetical protein
MAWDSLLLCTQQEQSMADVLGHAKLQWRWALDLLVLPLLAGVPLSPGARHCPLARVANRCARGNEGETGRGGSGALQVPALRRWRI